MAWQPLTPGLSDGLPAVIRHWVDIRTSVSAEIERVMQAPMSVAVVRQEDAPLLSDETGLIDPSEGPATIREVVLWAAGAPCVVARTAFSARKLRQDSVLKTLGNRPLGALLFAGSEVSPFTHRDLARINPGMAELYGLITRHHAPAETAYWARRTLFLLLGAPILCTEIFLPELLARTGASLPRPKTGFTTG